MNDKERCISEAKKYKTRSEWNEFSATSYRKAIEKKWLDECSAHMIRLKVLNNYWTKERCLNYAKKCKTKNEFRQKYPKVYSAAQKKDWYNEICSHLTSKIHYRGYTNEELINEFNKYETKRDIRRANPAMVLWATRKGLMPMLCKHMRVMGNKKKRQLYSIEHPDRTVYVGQSYDPKKRAEAHLNFKPKCKTDNILQEKRRKFQNKQILKIFPKFYSEENIGKAEKNLYEKYKKEGWVLLNTKSALGALGGVTTKWTLDECIKVSKLCSSPSELQKRFPSAYNAIRKKNYRPQCYAHMRNIKIVRYSCDQLLSTIRKVSSFRELREKFPLQYGAIVKRNKIKKWCKYLKRERQFHTYESILIASKKCKTRLEFFKRYGPQYAAAKRRGIFEKVTDHMPIHYGRNK